MTIAASSANCEPMYWLKHTVVAVVRRKPKLLVFFSFDILNEGVKAKIKEKRAETVTLENAATHRKGRSMKLTCGNLCSKILAQTNDQRLNMRRNVMVGKNGWCQIILKFPNF